MSAISLAEWGRYRDAGVTTFAVGPVTAPVAYLNRAEAEAAADEIDGTYIEWAGRTGHQVLTAAEAAAYAEAYPGCPEPEPKAELEASI